MLRTMLSGLFLAACLAQAAPAPRAPKGPRPKAEADPNRPRPDPSFDVKVSRPAHASRRPRVLFDQAHFNVHTPQKGYAAFTLLLINDGCRVEGGSQRLSREVLKSADLLVSVVPLGADGLGKVGAEKPAFTDDECDAIRDWVRAGGGLLLITDRFPSGHAVENLGKVFGVQMSKGTTMQDPAFLRVNGTLVDHAITRGRDLSESIEGVKTYTGQSFVGPPGSVALLKFPEDSREQIRDDKDPYWGPRELKSAAGRAMAIAFEFGSGRVVMIGDAAIFTADIGPNQKFGMSDASFHNRQFALNVTRWLTRALR
jgi:hypothetical protein